MASELGDSPAQIGVVRPVGSLSSRPEPSRILHLGVYLRQRCRCRSVNVTLHGRRLLLELNHKLHSGKRQIRRHSFRVMSNEPVGLVFRLLPLANGIRSLSHDPNTAPYLAAFPTYSTRFSPRCLLEYFIFFAESFPFECPAPNLPLYRWLRAQRVCRIVWPRF